MTNWDNESIKLMERFNDAFARGFYVNGTQLTELYNKVLGKKLQPTNCTTCIKGRYNELKREYDFYNAKREQAEVIEEPKTIIKKVGRPKKNS
ncbi:MAG: hypothetical protein KBT27_10490 [Prevotellaceae bacterium]|nr:hypothetical protein [Candidatus Faecinaster equi]